MMAGKGGYTLNIYQQGKGAIIDWTAKKVNLEVLLPKPT